MRYLLVLIVLLFTSVFAWGQEGISLSVVEGRVLVNQGEQFVPAQHGQTLYPGDRLMTIGQSTAVALYPDDCEVRVDPESVVTLPRVSTCAGGVVHMQRVNPAGRVAIGADRGGVGRIIAIAAFVVLGVCAITGDCDGDGSDTVSP